MIRIEKPSLRRGDKLLIDDSSLSIHPGEKIGLIGANGAGKSSLFAMLMGRLLPDGGDLSIPPAWVIAHVAQETPASPRSAVDYVCDGDAALRAAEAMIEQGRAAHDGHLEAEGHQAYADAGGYQAKPRAESLLLGLGFLPRQLAQPVSDFSGGWRMRLNLAQALMARSDLLLLDEPTNHLDLDAIVWLEDWLLRYPGTLICISHDREFLDAVCGAVIHLHGAKLSRYKGGYTDFEEQRAQQLVLQEAAYARQQTQIAHLQSFIDRFKAKASKAKQAQSRVKALEKIARIAPLRAESGFDFSFREPLAAPNPLIVLEDADCGYVEGQPVLHKVSLSIQAGQRIGLLGANGQGKSTLVKTLAATLKPLAGRRQGGRGLQIGYFAQHQLETLDEKASPLLHLARLSPDATEQELRNFLGGFAFHGDMATQPIAPLSGGEKARLALALIVWQRPNLLLLDEPTNHLDADTREALTVALAEFEGTLILVSHDRHLLRASAEQFLLVGEGRVQPFDGDLDCYRDCLMEQAARRRAEVSAAGEGKPSGESPDDTGVSSADRKEQRRLEAGERQRLAQARKPLEKKLAALDKRLGVLSEEKKALEARLADESSYAPEKKAELTEMLRRQAELSAELDEVELDWMTTQEEIDAINSAS
ncbi:MAG: ATP-binding cassette domain-containing protein [Candidatus Protistobacter heckmanni]|nr:ATP-binding cassette domain-containing protein [Candidatus Protistobacter heckmanni]